MDEALRKLAEVQVELTMSMAKTEQADRRIAELEGQLMREKEAGARAQRSVEEHQRVAMALEEEVRARLHLWSVWVGHLIHGRWEST